MKLKTTPTGGVDAAQSPYYRRLLSAGYKGFLQGTIGGASLYGAMGAVVGGLVCLPLMFIPGMPFVAALAIIPAGAGLGLVKGASTFGQIGSTAAINAESADLSEQRRYLLDRYYDLPEGPEGDREAAAIRHELTKRASDAERPAHFFHRKTLLIGAAIGAAVAGAAIFFAPSIFAAANATALAIALEGAIGVTISKGLAGALFALGGSGITAVGALAGAFTGAAIGIDRYYIRKWFDHTQDVVHSSSHRESALMERHQQVQRLQEAAKEDEKTKVKINASSEAIAPAAPAHTTTHAPEKAAPKPTASLSETPSTHISHATLQSRLAGVQETMRVAGL